MKTKLTLGALCLAILAGCAGEPTWDNSTFPATPVYGAAPAASTTMIVPGE